MEDEASILLDGKALGNLRVVDLKQELEKRGLSKSGSKKDLVKRLKQQLEFEKLCGERKSTGEGDLKLDLDAVTEQNEFVQRYLAQQQKIYAEQKEVKRLVELEEIQRSSDERGSDSPKAEDASDQETHPEENSDSDLQAETSENKAEITSAIREYSRKRGRKQPREAISKDKTETDSATIVHQELSRDSESNIDILRKKKTTSNLNDKATANIETKLEDPEVEISEDEKINSGSGEGGNKNADNEIAEKEISTMTNEKRERISKETKLEIIENENSSRGVDEKSNISESKVEIAKDEICCFGNENINAESEVENLNDKTVEKSGIESVEAESIKESRDDEDASMNESGVKNVENESMKESRVEIVDESMKESEVKYVEEEGIEEGKVENVKDESLEESKVKNVENESSKEFEVPITEDEGMKMSTFENESMEVPKPENVETESTIVSAFENVENESVKESRVEIREDETIEESKVEIIKNKSLEISRLDIVEKMETDSDFVEVEDADEKNVSSCSLQLVDHNVQIHKLSKRKSMEKTSITLKNHPSSLNISETEQNPALTMEPATEISSVPYSLSEIQLPDSPGSIMKPVSKSVPEESSTDKLAIEGKPNLAEPESHTNGTDSNSSEESPVSGKPASEPESTSTLNGESPKKEKSDSQSANSGDGIQDETKKPSEVDIPSKNEILSEIPKANKYSEGSEEGEMKSDSESGTEESSASNEHRHGRRKSRKVKRKRDHKRKSGSSDSSRSRSRENSDEKTNKIYMDSGLSTKSDVRSSSKGIKEKSDSLHSNVPTKQRPKLKRDNVIVSDSLHTSKKNSSVCEISEESSTSYRKNSNENLQPAMSEPNKTEPVEVQSVKYVSTRKIRLTSRKLSEKSEDEPKGKKGKWGSFSSSQKTSQAISISTDSLKNWFPDFKLLKNPENVSEVVFDDTPLPTKDESHPGFQVERMDESDDPPLNVVIKDEPKVSEPVADQPDKGGLASNILFIQNLVRPFTLLQLKELLRETGNFIEEKFWIDKIKSKCFVTYETEEEAVRTRNALNGSRWPSSNPKILSVEFGTEEDLHYHQSGSEPSKPAAPPPPVERAESREDRTVHPAGDFRKKEPERRKERTKLPVREWDKNKLTQESPTRERISKSAERFKPSDKREKKDAKRQPNEDTPAKLLDDLFQKTKSSPCIYWLPLTEEQVVEREESIRLRRMEREKRNQQREQEENEHKTKSVPPRNRTRETETRRSSTRSRSPVSRRR